MEDYFHVTGFEGVVHRRRWDDYECRVRQSTQRVLRLLERHQVRATFFILGWVARKEPGLVREIHRAGHEIGCHSYWHRLVYRLTPDAFERDLRDAQAAICDVTGEPLRAYRAPSFSITQRSLWALDILAGAGIEYDSSIYPVVHDRYGIARTPMHPYRLACSDRLLWEFPLPAYPLLGANVPVGGGGYLRLYPIKLTVACLRAINHRFGRPFAVTVHPWELDPDQPRLRAPRLSRFRHYVNLHTTEGKVQTLLKAFRFGTLTDAVHGYCRSRAALNGFNVSATHNGSGIPEPLLTSRLLSHTLRRRRASRIQEEAAA